MSSPATRIRADLQARTGVDFSQYVDDELIDSVTGWSGLWALVEELALSVGAGLLLPVAAVVATVAADLSADEETGLIIGGVVMGIGMTALTFSYRLRRRVPAEAGKVFEVAGTAVDRVAEDAASGRLTISAADAVRGVTLVAAIPALTRAARRRFPLLGSVAAPAAGAVLSRALIRVWPAGRGSSASLSGLERPAAKMDDTLRAVREAVLPKISTAVRWATLPLAGAGVVIMTLGAAVALISLSLD